MNYVGSINPYYAELTPGAVFDELRSRIPVVPMGVVAGDGKTVTHISEHGGNNERWFEIALDEHYAGSSRAFIGAASVYELELDLQRSLSDEVDTTRAQARALGFAVEYLTRMFLDEKVADRALKTLTAQKGLPVLGMSEVRHAMLGLHVLEERQVDRLSALIKPIRAQKEEN